MSTHFPYQVYFKNMPDIFFPSHLKFMSGIFQTYTTHILSESFGNMPGLFLCLRIGPGLQQQCDWDATAVTVHVFWVSRVFNIQRQTWRARMSTPERQQMQRSMDCDVAAAANPRKIS